MKLSIFLLILCLALNSCSSEKGPTEKEEIETNDSVSLSLVKQSLESISNSTWIFQPFPNCTDTLTLKTNNGTFYRCEQDLDFRIEYTIQSDTLYVDLYGLVSEMDPSLGEHIETKYKFIKADNKLMVAGVAYRFRDTFEPVENQYPTFEYRQIQN